RCCPVLCGLRDRCIAAMLATLGGRLQRPRREGGVEPPPVKSWLTPVFASREMDEHQGSAPCIPVWKTGVYLSTPMLGEMEFRVGISGMRFCRPPPELLGQRDEVTIVAWLNRIHCFLAS